MRLWPGDVGGKVRWGWGEEGIEGRVGGRRGGWLLGVRMGKIFVHIKYTIVLYGESISNNVLGGWPRKYEENKTPHTHKTKTG
jgi:hypothetical protein